MSLRNGVNKGNTDQMTRSNTREVKNNAGGYVYQLNDKDRFVRALTLGSDQGTFYVNAKEMATDTVVFMQDYINKSGIEAVNTIVEISDSGRASKNTYAIFALAVAMTAQDVETRIAARKAVDKVCRTFFHLTELAADLDALGAGWGSAKTKAFAGWYESKDAGQLAAQAVKYRSRNGYSHRDIMRISHPKIADKNLASFMLSLDGADRQFNKDELPQVAQNFINISTIDNVSDAVDYIKNSEGTVAWEFLKTELLNNAEIWAALLDRDMVGYTALLRNLNRFVKCGLFEFDGGRYTFIVAEKFSDVDRIKKGRIHPMNILNALRQNESYFTYNYSKTNSVLPNAVKQALEDALDKSFKNVEASGKIFYLGVDVSGSMGSLINEYNCYGLGSVRGVSCRDFAALLTAQVAKKEKKSYIKGFTSNRSQWDSLNLRSGSALTDLGITGNDSFSAVVEKMKDVPFGGTDCALPILDALERKLYVDEFVVITDNETWAGKVKVVDALAQYRETINPNARFVVVACSASKFTIGDPIDKWTLNVSGADSAVLQLISDFAKD